MSVSTKLDYKVFQINVVIAFLYDFLDEFIYVYQSITLENDSNLVYLLRKTLYNLKQLSRVWYKTLQDFLAKLRFKQTNANHELFVSKDKSIFIAIYVDDLLIFDALDNSRVNEIMQHFCDRFQMINFDEILHYLEMKIDVDVTNKQIILWQFTYFKKIVTKYELINCKLVKISMSLEISNLLDLFDEQTNKYTIAWYQSIVKAFIWSIMHSRLDFAQLIEILSRYCSNLESTHITFIK